MDSGFVKKHVMNSLLGYEQAKLVDCDNKRFLSFVQHCKKQNEDKKTLASDSMMVPTGDYVVLEVELVSKELNHLADILHDYAGGLSFMK